MAGGSRRRTGTGARRTGVVTRGELRGAPPEPRRDGLLVMGVIGMVALAVLVVLNGAFAAPGPTPDPTPVIEPSAVPTDPPFSPRPPATASPSEAPLPSPSAVPSATASPSPSPSPSPTPSPTPEPTASPTPAPTSTPTAEPTPTASHAPTAPADGLIILEPVDRSVAAERSILVRGLAPPGATITRDIRFWLDQHTTADANGHWSMAVELASGENLITLRLGDRPATQQTLVVYYSP